VLVRYLVLGFLRGTFLMPVGLTVHPCGEDDQQNGREEPSGVLTNS
jgi:hypothetical protein